MRRASVLTIQRIGSKMDKKREEWEAWEELVEELRKLGVDINEHDHLNALLLLWARKRHNLYKESE